ncbi:hypothetical protein GGI25_004926 [Coemansia spiralis]|uniref:Uncharacterized protein n=2 Tax=Coemansia TaxID=4863 RepID=A0A9W8G5N4_9FUNG|nr:hypothetical protein EDC05_005185 [Coemansia umbellata]KAJ2622429.1 hypothetical protein GGI26_003292 [Coemansia sp. RSA 1358]KAJ2672883.1 hypothetical protein GGI25_004926 [Coemansia spiralis]
MQSFIQALRRNKPFVIGMIVAPLGLYTGLKVKDWRDCRRAEVVKREIEYASTQQATQKEPDAANDIRVELQALRNARSLLRRQEAQLALELESIEVKLSRLDAMDADKDKKQD